MGERHEDVVDMALALRRLQVESIPINFLNPIPGTPLAGQRDLNPRFCLKVLAMVRFVCPSSELRIAGGRELHLGHLQCLGLYPANSIFVGDYLTTRGQPPAEDFEMIRQLGFEITRVGSPHSLESPGSSAAAASDGAAAAQCCDSRPGAGAENGLSDAPSKSGGESYQLA
jgi:biotin synthase-like enzyme